MQLVNDLVEKYLSKLHIPSIIWTDVVEIFIIAFLLYHIMLWIKNTRAWALLKGLLVIGAFVLIAVFFKMNTILWIVTNLFSIAAIAIVVVLQPELRKALEELGRKNLFSSILTFDSSKPDQGRLSDRTINEIVKACVEMGKVKTGALIVIQNEQPLNEYERTGIDVDGIVSSQLLINIFEHNTPLHDGAVIVRENRVTAATCYLPLSDNMALSKDLGTRHRAGVGISEATDSMTVIVSEETGKISVAYHGELSRGLDAERLKEMLRSIQNKAPEEKKRKLWKGRSRNEE
ncbi:MAG: TIGR00159 family protein [Lachnospiraceae bacterium]|jgi:diadenylate cyclase|nr:TIGR00159 family protein [Lachnospiraceae bacterium]MDE7275780.1 diadenylate cyclase CdaA [Lachnospiraceae bacterium]MDE7339412.1 diadenylate cyclase CdaA [Lachnospiraceae bacterium]